MAELQQKEEAEFAQDINGRDQLVTLKEGSNQFLYEPSSQSDSSFFEEHHLKT